MNAYEVIRNVHRIGSPLSATVIDRTILKMSGDSPMGHLTLATASEFHTILPYDFLTDDRSLFAPELIPQVGDQIETVVYNFVDGTLYLSRRPRDLQSATIREWQAFYDYVDTLTIGNQVMGVVAKAMPFGLFVNIGSSYLGLIDIGHKQFNLGRALPINDEAWPRTGDEIRCIIGYVRFHNRQIGLGWMPDQGA